MYLDKGKYYRELRLINIISFLSKRDESAKQSSLSSRSGVDFLF